MNKFAFILWLSLVVYTIIYVLLIQADSMLFISILQGEADPFAASFFNLMGLVPIYFLMDYLCFQPHSKWGVLPFLFGFVGGAFSILLGYQKASASHRHNTKWIQFILITLMILTAVIMTQAFWFGNPVLYVRLFLSDSLVGIMTVDFLVLYVWSIYRSKQLFRNWYLASIPVIGFGLLMLLNQRR